MKSSCPFGTQRTMKMGRLKPPLPWVGATSVAHFQVNEKGFTFLEIIAVLVIIGILSALAVPDLSAFSDRLRLETAARSISTDLREMKMRATLDRSSYTVSFDIFNNLYILPERNYSLPSGISFGFSAGVLGPPSNPVSEPDPDGVTFPSNRATFYPQGSNSIGAIYITNDDNMTMAVSMSITGKVKIWKWTGEKWI